MTTLSATITKGSQTIASTLGSVASAKIPQDVVVYLDEGEQTIEPAKGKFIRSVAVKERTAPDEPTDDNEIPVEQWDSTKEEYTANKILVVYNQSLYLCLVTHKPSSDFDADLAKNYWKKIGDDAIKLPDSNGAEPWNKEKEQYIADTSLVTYNQSLYLCLITHKPSTDFKDDLAAGLWKRIDSEPITLPDSSSVKPWNSETKQYTASESLVTYKESLYLCLITHNPSSSFDDDLAKEYWKRIDSEPAEPPIDNSGAKPWDSEAEQYVANKSLTTHNQSLYLCLVTHKPSAKFDDDLAKGYWKKIDSDQTIISSNGYSQITKKDVTAPKIVSMAINGTPYLCLPPVEILKAGAQETNVSVKLNDFSASDEAQFTHTDNVEFGDFGMKLKNDYDVPMSIPVALGSAGYISQSDEIDFSVYKSVERVDV